MQASPRVLVAFTELIDGGYYNFVGEPPGFHINLHKAMGVDGSRDLCLHHEWKLLGKALPHTIQHVSNLPFCDSCVRALAHLYAITGFCTISTGKNEGDSSAFVLTAQRERPANLYHSIRP